MSAARDCLLLVERIAERYRVDVGRRSMKGHPLLTAVGLERDEVIRMTKRYLGPESRRPLMEGEKRYVGAKV